uniref:Uncharacterized protein n=1 Tax=Timema poppense TaxID=170557 RepID=A0A7R9D7M9_TIMPO|nr:unnamed protein product [Timema poppensis]
MDGGKDGNGLEQNGPQDVSLSEDPGNVQPTLGSSLSTKWSNHLNCNVSEAVKPSQISGQTISNVMFQKRSYHLKCNVSEAVKPSQMYVCAPTNRNLASWKTLGVNTSNNNVAIGDSPITNIDDNVP